MLRRANTLVTRARERIRAATEHDPHGWPERDDDRAILVRDDEAEAPPPPAPAPDGNGATRPPLGSPEPGAPDLDSADGRVSGPPDGARVGTGPASRRTAGRDRGGDTLPAGLRIAADWSWRGIPLGGEVFPPFSAGPPPLRGFLAPPGRPRAPPP